MTSRLKAYLAAPLFNCRERDFNEAVSGLLSPYVDVFVPQRDGYLLSDMIAAGVPLVVAERRIFEQDTRAMADADFLVAILDGAAIDDGVAFEIGFMRALGKRCVALQTDVRRALPSGNNPMIGQALESLFHEIDELVVWVKAHASADAPRQSDPWRNTA
tara:strand:- start:13790 stop:14269 length:480 start_codon:yes stop_codon:yes gene_type:complete